MSTPMASAHVPFPMPGLAGLLAQLPGARVVGALPENILRVHTDTRSLQAGDLFVALRGDRFDAHDFLPQANSQGAVAALAGFGLSHHSPFRAMRRRRSSTSPAVSGRTAPLPMAAAGRIAATAVGS